MQKKNKLHKLNNQEGGDVISASIDLINSFISLGGSIFTEVDSLTHISSQINNGAAPSPGTPNVINGPPPFHPPPLNQ
jgi:hypothetical protein